MLGNSSNSEDGCFPGGCFSLILVIVWLYFYYKTKSPGDGFGHIIIYSIVFAVVYLLLASIVIIAISHFFRNRPDSKDPGGHEGCLSLLLSLFKSKRDEEDTEDDVTDISPITLETHHAQTSASNGASPVNSGHEGLKQSQTSQDGQNSNTGGKGSTTDNPTKLYLTEQQFTNLKNAVNELMDYCQEVGKDKEIYDYIIDLTKKSNPIYDMPEFTISVNVPDMFYGLAMKDVFSCMASMGFAISTLYGGTFNLDGTPKINCTRFEGQALLALMMLSNDKFLDYSKFRSLLISYMSGKDCKEITSAERSLNDYLQSNTSVSTEEAEVKDYQVALILKSISRDEESQKYKKILYKIAFCFAYADGTLSTEEKLFLKQLGNDAGIIEVGITVDSAPDESLDSLDHLIGLKEVKNDIKSLVNFITVNQKRKTLGMKVPSVSYHCVFTGNPGTGKTTVARILAGIYKNLGIVETGQLVETDRSGLVAEYVGQTAVKTNKIIDKAIGGVLFIDEAYSLVQGGDNDYGKEAISTLLKRMEDDRDKLVVILAGYTKEMEDFINSNPGLRSRFSRYIHFPDYTAEELFQIFELNMQKFEYHLSDDAKPFLQKLLEERVAHKRKDFGNAREVRNLFEKVVESQADRLQKSGDMTKEMLSEIKIDDIRNAI